MEALRAFLFGITVAAPVGPIALLLVRTGLNHRYSAALAGALGVALADFTYAVAALSAGSGAKLLLQAHQRGIQFAASALLIALGIWLAAGALRARALSSDADAATGSGEAPGWLRLYLLTLANPLTILLFVGFSGQMTTSGDASAIAIDALCLFLGSLIVQVCYATLGALLQRWLTSPALVRAFNTASGLGIAAFGVYGLCRVV